MHIEDAPPVKPEGEASGCHSERPKWKTETAQLGRRGIKMACMPYLRFWARLHVLINAATFVQKLQIFFFLLALKSKELHIQKIPPIKKFKGLSEKIFPLL